MQLSGITFIRNGIAFGYPFKESMLSMLPLVDELIVVVGRSDDGTREAVASLGSGKIRIIDTVWDEKLRTGGKILAQQTDIALEAASHPWCFYLQGDEVLHEDDQSILREALTTYDQVPAIQGLLFNYLHFYGSYAMVGHSRKWYRREVRLFRNHIGIRSWGDAQGFRRNGEKLHVAHVPARIFHYGWVKPPEVQQRKLGAFHKLWHDDAWVAGELGEKGAYRYEDGGRLRKFAGSHPAVMVERIANADWKFDPDMSLTSIPLKDRVLDRLEDATGWRAGEYRNYILEDIFTPRG